MKKLELELGFLVKDEVTEDDINKIGASITKAVTLFIEEKEKRIKIMESTASLGSIDIEKITKRSIKDARRLGLPVCDEALKEIVAHFEEFVFGE